MSPTPPTARPGLSRLALCSTLALVCTLTGAHTSHADEPDSGEYTLTLLQPADGHTVAAAYGINESGDVTGITRPGSAAQPQQAALWTTGTTRATALPQLNDSRFGRGFDLSATTTVAGEAFDAAGVSVPVAWTKDSVAQLPSVSPLGRGVAVDIAETGRVLGVAHDGAMGVAYVIDGTTPTALAAPSPDEGTLSSYRAAAISPDGRWVAGVSWVDVPHGDHSHRESLLTIWQDGRPITWEPEDHGPGISPAGILDSGLVVGTVKPRKHAVAATWRDGTLTTLTDPGIEGFPHVTATAGNTSGLIVGTASRFEGNSGFGGAAVAWRDGTPVDLNTLVTLPEGVTLQDARDINGAGQIVGTARTAEGTVGYLLTPRRTPAPTPNPSPGPSTGPTTAPAPSSAPTAAPTPSPGATRGIPAHPAPSRPGLPGTGD
ncbi:hypothetical protein EII34_06760 [Arachnia propionica]|uniref:Uncharacterized protein n=1 Tax=Arachnia propionica TaxID=1750 RepID=A0A3P1T994_9ACTN|nr:hypothetical protein [Arachnia propionica]RRD05426.1 hypothetical protein EII34_06760 [Arachnia propionica]